MRRDPAQPPAVPHFFLYGEAPRDADDRFLHLEALDDRSRPNRWTIRPHVHSSLHQLLLIAEGGGEMRAEAERLAVAPPCLLVVPAGTAHGFRFGPAAYAPDVSLMPEPAKAMLRGLDLLIIDALRETPHPSHYSVSDALALIEDVAPKRAILTNLHTDLDYATLAKKLPPGVVPAYDGLSVSVDL